MLSPDRYIFASDAKAAETQRAFQSLMRSVVPSREERGSPLPAARRICNFHVHVTQRNRDARVFLEPILPLDSIKREKRSRALLMAGENNAADNADGSSAEQLTKLYMPRRVNSRGLISDKSNEREKWRDAGSTCRPWYLENYSKFRTRYLSLV